MAGGHAVTRWAMVFNLDRCIGCWACAVACKSENSVGEGLWWQQVDTIGGPRRDTATGAFPQLDKHYQPRNCFHCADAPCLPACPEGAISQRADGIVEIDYDACTGCGDCIQACPYDAISLNTMPPSLPNGLEAGHGDAAVAPRRQGVAEKCTFCAHRLDRGQDPACVAACPTDVISFGDLDDPASAVADKATRTDARRPKEDSGAKPAAWYLPYSVGARQRRSGGS